MNYMKDVNHIRLTTYDELNLKSIGNEFELK